MNSGDDDLFRRTTLSPAEIVPDGFRSRRLPEEIREWVERKADIMARDYQRVVIEEEEGGAAWRREEENLLDDSKINWFGHGSERTVFGLGRTVGGSPIYNDLTGVVVKLNPWLRLDEYASGRIGSVAAAGNLHELAVWSWADSNDLHDHFGHILDYGDRGDWLAMEQCIPVFRSKFPRLTDGCVDHITESMCDVRMIDGLVEDLAEHGVDPHTKDGNIGLRFPEFQPVVIDHGSQFQPVVIDYGSHVEIEDVNLTEFIMDH
jgi:hypothetical protein